MFLWFPKQFSGHSGVSALIGMRQIVSAGDNGTKLSLQAAAMVAQEIANVVQADKMSVPVYGRATI